MNILHYIIILSAILSAIVATTMLCAFALRRLKSKEVDDEPAQDDKPSGSQAGSQALPVLRGALPSNGTPHQQGVHQPKHGQACRCRNTGGCGQEHAPSLSRVNGPALSYWEVDWGASRALSTAFVKGIKVMNHISPDKQVLTEVFINHWKPSILMYGDSRPTLNDLSDAVFDFERGGLLEPNEDTNLKP